MEKMFDIEPLLVRWGIWSSQRESNGLGYPRKCLTFRLASSGGVANYDVPFDEPVQRIERIIAKIGSIHPELKRLAMLMYVRAFPSSSIARIEKIDERTVRRRKNKLCLTVSREYHNAA